MILILHVYQWCLSRTRGEVAAKPHPRTLQYIQHGLCWLLDPTYNLFFGEISQCCLEGFTAAGLLRSHKHFPGMSAAGTFITINVQAGWDLSNSPKFSGHFSSLPVVSHCPVQHLQIVTRSFLSLSLKVGSNHKACMQLIVWASLRKGLQLME